MKKKNQAFTLAEVLITLTIIGVVSALTIPTLVQKTNKQEYVSALQKAYSTLSQATNMIIAENGSPKASEGGWAQSSETVYEMYKRYLNNIKDCGGESGCVNQGAWKYQNTNLGSFAFSSSGYKKFILADGMQIVIDGVTFPSCEGSAWGTDNICAYMWIDVNGAKSPNLHGKDFFAFAIKETGLYPFGCDDETKDECNKNSYGRGCACKVLREGKMDY